MILPGLGDRLAWMAKNIYVTCTCGICSINGIWCDECKQATLNANGGRLPSTWDGSKRKALEDFISRNCPSTTGAKV